VIPIRRRSPPREYDVDAAFMSLIQHERGIHALCFGTNGAGVTEARSHTCVLPYRTDKLTGITLWMLLSWLMPYFESGRRPTRARA